MVFYYEQNQPMYFAVLVFSRTITIFGMVARRVEFWLFFFMHCTFVLLFRLDVLGVGEFERFRWEAVSATQLFMVFCLTFFNGHCFARYLELYDHCMNVLDGALFFVQEMVVSLSPPRVETFRIRAVKYVVAMLHIFFMGVCGGMKTRAEWRELVKRGLLSRVESEQLQTYPARSIEVVLVLATWSMQIVDKALEDDAFWEFRSMRIAHTHNRLQSHMNSILLSIHSIGDILALPIPFPYYHIMNVVIIFNLFMLTAITASFSTYQTIFPFVVALMFFLGLREVSSSLADPFDGEDCDFPIGTFLQYSFDTSICLLEAFRSGSPEYFVGGLLDQTIEFTNEQLRHVLPHEVLYQKDYDPTINLPFSWNQEMPLALLAGTPQGPEYSLNAHKMVIGKHDIYSDKSARLAFNRKIEKDKEEDKDEYIRVCLCCKRKKRKLKIPEVIGPPTKDMLIRAVQVELEGARDDNRKLQSTALKWRDTVQLQQNKINLRIARARERGYPIDEFLGMQEVHAQPKVQKRELEFETFDEPHELLMDALTMSNPDNNNLGKLLQQGRGRTATVRK